MEMSKVEIIEPIPNETYFSWIWRLGDWYGYTKLNDKDYYLNFMKQLFGNDSKMFVSLHVPSNLQYFVNKINLPNSSFFRTSKSIINEMTLFRFYKNFMTYEERNKFLKLLEGKNELINAERKLGLRSNSSYYEDFPRIKFCKDCIAEKGSFYLEVEHQVQGNLVCYKHANRLQFAPFNFKEISSYRYFADNWEGADYCITLEDELVTQYKVMAKMVHQVMLGDLVDSIIKIKSKIRKKLSELGWLYDTYYIFDIDKFLIGFEKYNVYSITKVTLFFLLYNTGRRVNAIMYLSLIHYLFGSLEEYYAYVISDDEIVDLKRHGNFYEAWLRGPYNDAKSFDHYSNILQKRLGSEFTLVECKVKDKKITIRHNICGRERELNKSSIKKFKFCHYCYYKKNNKE